MRQSIPKKLPRVKKFRRNIRGAKDQIRRLAKPIDYRSKGERDISLANLATLRMDIQELKVTNLQLAQGQEFLTTSLAKKGGMDLQVIGAKIAPLPENAYEYIV